MGTDGVKVRLSDVAAQAEVSEATVSRVMNDRPGVSAAARAAVLTAIDVLGYERPMRLRRAGSLVGLIVPELTNPIFPAFAQTIESGLAQHGFTSVLCTQTPSGVHEDDYVRMLLERGVAGIIFISGAHADFETGTESYVKLHERGLPMVLVNGFRDGVDATFVGSDDAAAIELSVRHLVELGHRRIGLALGPERYVPVSQKMATFRREAGRLVGGDDIDDLIVNTLFTVEGGGYAAGHLLAKGATAIVCGSDLMALGAIRHARRMGLVVPRDLSIVGYDDSLLMGFTDPPLTTVRQSVIDMSEVAVRALTDQIRGLPVGRSEFVFRPELVVRGSTARAPTSAGTAAGQEGVEEGRHAVR